MVCGWLSDYIKLHNFFPDNEGNICFVLTTSIFKEYAGISKITVTFRTYMKKYGFYIRSISHGKLIEVISKVKPMI